MNNSPSDEPEDPNSRREDGAVEPEQPWELPGDVPPSGEQSQLSDPSQPGHTTSPGHYPHGYHPPSSYPPGPYPPGPFPPGSQPPGNYPPTPYPQGPYPPPGYPHAGQSGYSPHPGYVPQQTSKAFSFPVQLGIGTGIGALISGLLVIVLFTSAGAGPGPTVILSLIAVAAGVACLFVPKIRGYGTGALIVIFAAWLVLIGPCLALFYG